MDDLLFTIYLISNTNLYLSYVSVENLVTLYTLKIHSYEKKIERNLPFFFKFTN